MSITNANVICRLRALVSRSSTGNCAQPQQEIWFPVAPTVTQLPPVPAETINPTPIPANSAELPPDFDLDNPDLCSLFTSILSESTDAVYEVELEVASLVLPFNETVVRTALLRTYFDLYRFNYSLKPRLQNVSLVAKAKSTSVRLYKFKKASLALSVAGQDAKIYPTRILVAAKATFVITAFDAAITPVRIFCDKGTFTTSFAAAAIQVPGMFSYGWASAVGTALGDPSPIGIGYRRNIHQSLYSKDILLANGARAGAVFKNLRWYVTTAISPSYSILGMNIRLFHSTALNASSTLTPKAGETKTVVYSDASTIEFVKAETVGVLQINFLTNFVWDGVNSIVVESCTSQNQTNYQSQGGLRKIDGSVAVRRHSWTDNTGSSCGDTPTSTYTDQISIQMDFS